MRTDRPAGDLLLVDAQGGVGAALRKALASRYRLHGCRSAAEAIGLAGACRPAVILVDAALPDMAMGPFIRRLSQACPDSLILALVEAHQSLEASEAIRHGAIDYLQKPVSATALLAAIAQAALLWQPIPNLIVASHASRQVLQLARRAAQTTATILIGGESGTGKECLARFIHEVSPRAGGPYVAVNCAAIPENLLESTLFGHQKGAFTGAALNQAGKFELAHGGTLLLDEISELPLALQAKLLRVLQEREVERLGSHQSRKLDVRVIAASNRDLRALVACGEFRKDLFYRLDVLPLSWPSLRERRDDILPLAHFFIDKHGGQPGTMLSPATCQALLDYAWPGNVRELENVMQRALILARGPQLQPTDLLLPGLGVASADSAVPGCAAEGLAASKRSAEYQYVLETLRRFDGHRTRTAEALGLTTRALRYKLAAMREQGLDIEPLAKV